MIKMEHPELPKTVDDPPAQLWAKREDTQVSLPDPLDQAGPFAETHGGVTGRNVLAQYGNRRDDPRHAKAEARRNFSRRDG